MPSKLELLLEAEKRGLLPADKLSMLAEARKRGLVQGTQEGVLSQALSVAKTPLPGLSQTAQALRHTVPEAIAETAGQFGSAAGIAGAGVGTVIGLVGELIPATVGEGALLAASPLAAKGMGLGFKAAGRGLGKVAEKASAPFKRQFMAAKGQVAMRIAKKLRVTLTPAEATGSKVLSAVESVLEKTPLGGDVIGQWRRGQMEAAGRAADTVLRRFGRAELKEVSGGKLQDAIEKVAKARAVQASEMFKAAAETLPQETFIPTAGLAKRAGELLKQEMSLPASARDKGLQKILTELEQRPGGDYQGITTLMSEMGSRVAGADAGVALGRPGMKFLGSRAGGAYKQLKKALEADLDGFAAETGGTFKGAYDAARAFYREGKELFGGRTIRAMLKSDPEAVARVVIRPGVVTPIKTLKTAVGEDAILPLKRSFLEDLMTRGPEGSFSPAKFTQALDAYGDETLAALFKSDELAAIGQLRHLSRFLGRAEKIAGNPSGTAQNVIGYSQGMFMLMSPVRGVLAALTPRVVARAYLHPTTRRWLTSGLRTPIDSKRAGDVSQNILRAFSAVGAQAYGAQPRPDAH